MKPAPEGDPGQPHESPQAREFALIERYFTRPPPRLDAAALGVGDDCALLDVPPGMQLAVTIDTLVEGVHFFPGTAARALGHKSLAVGLSDLAAMGAKPAWATLALTLPEVSEPWLEAFSGGLFELAERHRIQLVGGDTTRGPLSITLQCHGLVERGKALTRAGARLGDGIWVSGWPGEAALALEARRGRLALRPDWRAYLDGRLDRPQPRVAQGRASLGLASAAIDLSDGLVADLGHILARSRVGARLQVAALPLSPALAAHLDAAEARQRVLRGGDDYELCITVPPSRECRMARLHALGVGWTRVGTITADRGLVCVGLDGSPLAAPVGFRHFDDG